MKRFGWLFWLLIWGAVPASYAQIAALTGYCTLGATPASTSGLKSTNYLNGVIPKCTVAVYLTGTQTLATIYSDNISTPLANPFTATTLGQWTLFSAVNVGYDVVMSGGIPPNSYASPVTLTGLYPGFSFSGGGGSGNVIATPQYRVFIQPNAGTQAVAQGASTTQNAVAPLMQGIYNSDLYATGGGNNGIANLLAGPCVTAGCFFARPFTSTDTENIPNQLTGEYVHALDSLYGSKKHYYFNAGINGSTTARNAEEHNYFWNDTLAISNENLVGRNNTYTSAQAGIYVGSPWTIAKESNSTDYFYTRSISEHGSSQTYCFHVGDCVVSYDYLYPRGGSIGSSDESVKGTAVQIDEAFGPYGTINTGGANATVINSHFTTAGGNQGDGYNLVDIPDVMASGLLTANTITAGDQPNYWTTSDTHAVSTGIATLSSDCGANVTRNAPVSTVCSVTIVSGSFTAGAGATVCVGDWKYPEQVNISAVGSGTLTLGLTYFHPAGMYIEQGGMCGSKIALGYGIDPTTTGTREFTTYFGVGSHSANTIDYVDVFKGGQNGKQFVPVPSILTVPVPLGSITRSGNVVTVSNPGQNYPLNQFVAPGTSAITVAGATPSDLNGTVTGVTVTPSTITWHQTGADETGSGGTLSVTGYNNYIAPCGAETVKVMDVVMDTTGKPVTDGTLQVEPNNCPWTPGDAVAQPNHYASNVVGMNIALNGFTTPDGEGNRAIDITAQGRGWNGATMLNFTGLDPLSAFQGFGGTEMPRQFASGNDYYGDFFDFAHAPLNGHAVLNIGSSAEGVNANSYNYQVIAAEGVGGLDLMDFSPSTDQFMFGKLQTQALYISNFQPINTVVGNAAAIMTTAGTITPGDVLASDANKNIADAGFTPGSICRSSGANCPTPFISSLTTTGSSGPASVTAGVLNIPQYAGGGGGVTSINTTPGAFTFSGSGVSCTGTTCTFSGTGTGIGSITWALPSWLAASPTTISASGTQTFAAATGQTSHQVLGTCGTATSFGPCALVAGDIPALPYLSSGTQLPVTKTAITHQFFTAYDSTTGLYTAAALLSGDIPNNAASTSGNAATATALASTPTLCSTGQAPTGVLANGNATGCAAIGGSGTVTHTGALTAGSFMLGNGTADSKVSPNIDDGITTASTITSTEPISAPSFKASGTTPGAFSLVAGTGSIPALPANSFGFAAPVTGGTSYLFKPPATITAGILHAAAAGTVDAVNESALTSGPVSLTADVSGLLPNANLANPSTTVNGVTCTLGSTCTVGVANTTTTVGTTAVAANTCSSAVTVTMTGVATTSVFDFTPNSDVSGTTGWGSTGGLTIVAWPTANTLNYKVCNQTASSITPGASVTFNVGAR